MSDESARREVFCADVYVWPQQYTMLLLFHFQFFVTHHFDKKYFDMLSRFNVLFTNKVTYSIKENSRC